MMVRASKWTLDSEMFDVVSVGIRAKLIASHILKLSNYRFHATIYDMHLVE